MFTRILVPTDFSEPSDAALSYAKVLAERFGAMLHLVHIFEDPVMTGGFGAEGYLAEAPELAETLRQEAEDRLAVRLTESERNHLRATSAMLSGPTAHTIVDTARDRGFDLIVMGTHGRTGLAHALMGSVAERVVRTAPCPVLTVHSAPQPVALAVPAFDAAALPA